MEPYNFWGDTFFTMWSNIQPRMWGRCSRILYIVNYIFFSQPLYSYWWWKCLKKIVVHFTASLDAFYGVLQRGGKCCLLSYYTILTIVVLSSSDVAHYFFCFSSSVSSPIKSSLAWGFLRVFASSVAVHSELTP